MASLTALPPTVVSLPATPKWRVSPKTNAVLVGSVTFFAAILRLHALTAKSFWLDEGISVEIARLPWAQFLFVLRHREANMALYYLLLRVWLAMGSSEGFI